MNDSDLSCKSNINLQFTNNWGASGGRNFSITDTINSKDAWNTLGAGWQLNSAGCTINDCSATQVGPSQRTTNSGSDTYPATLYYCGDGQCACGENSSTCSADCAPSAPTGLNASCSALGTSVTLSWGAVSGETYYVVRVGVVGQPTTEYTVSGTSSTSYTPPVAGATYNWWVKACNSGGCSSETKGSDFACVGNVSGIVYEDQKNNCPASGAPVLGGVVVTVFTSPSKTTTTDAGGNYAINDLAAGSWAITATKTDYTPSVCSANSVTIESGRTATLDLYLRPPLPWFQTQGGDVHSQQNIYSKIPSLLNTYFSLDQYSYPGVVSYGGSSASFGLTPVSTRGWRPNSSLTFAKYNYDYFYKRLGAPTVDDFSCGSGCPTPPLGVTTAYYSADSVTIDRNNSWTIPANTKVMVLVNGDLNISLNPNNRRITVPVGSFLGFFVKGNINIDSAIGNKQTGYDVQPFLEGVYIVDGVIDTYASDLQGLGSGRRLIGAGIFYAKGGVLLKRELKSNPDPLAMQNSNTPAELFIFRPDLVMNSPRELWTGNLNWIEVAP
ncbi:MAG: carboxypeptidase-like regulatory domain-containing protein [bacterium]|nr:carboxypeptidase-like regulatory domain-containing protein [bacterium]